ncbi:LysR family transcriptional regulator [Pseudoduganella sp. CY13W]|uniref:LysR family transcriptional regulator n=2 Tax=Duganella qianjiadongensis TaxID=2692176 RepID=A0ABW9VR01_9BURK|nr:LysR family transcriptional regulator [Duganella qianjiadongensis]
MPQPSILVRPRIYIGADISIGPGKIDLLRRIDETRSIAAAARAMGIPYKRAWLLLDALNQAFGRPLIQTASGGKGGGGATLTPLGLQLVICYAALEERLNADSTAELEALRGLATSP